MSLLERSSRVEGAGFAVGWATSPGMGGSVTTQVITDDEAFAQLAEQWDRLVAGCVSATPFQTHAWLNSWWRAYGTPGRLRVVLVYRGCELVGAAALYLSQPLPVRTLLPLGAGVSDFCDVLVLDAVGEQRLDVVCALSSALRRMKGWDIIDFPEVRPGAALAELAAHWPAGSSSTPASICLELPVQDLSDLIASLPTSTARNRRQKLRKLDHVNITCKQVAVHDARAAVARFHRLHLEQWEGRGINPEHTRPRFRAFLTEALPLMVDRNQAIVSEYHLDGDPVAVVIDVVDSSLLGGYLYGMSPILREHIDIGTLLLRDSMRQAIQHKTPVLSLLRGVEEYKLRWRPEPVQNRRVVLGRPRSVLALPYLVAANGRARAMPWLRQHAPWLRDLRAGRARLPGARLIASIASGRPRSRNVPVSSLPCAASPRSSSHHPVEDH